MKDSEGLRATEHNVATSWSKKSNTAFDFNNEMYVNDYNNNNNNNNSKHFYGALQWTQRLTRKTVMF